MPAYKSFVINTSVFRKFHGMEEVVGSIPTRSTKESIAYGFAYRLVRNMLAANRGSFLLEVLCFAHGILIRFPSQQLIRNRRVSLTS